MNKHTEKKLSNDFFNKNLPPFKYRPLNQSEGSSERLNVFRLPPAVVITGGPIDWILQQATSKEHARYLAAQIILGQPFNCKPEGKTSPPFLKNEILDLLQYKPGGTVSIRTTLPPMSWKGINQPKRGKNQSFRSVQFGAVY